MLPIETFNNIIKHTPLIYTDLIIPNQAGNVLLGKPKNRPAQGYWFVPGGRILNDESMSVAFKRLTLNELGVELNIDKAGFIGPFEHFYVDNVSGECLSTHYIALCYRLLVDDTLLNLPTEQHSQYKWISVDELLSDAEVHKHSRWYFDPSAS